MLIAAAVDTGLYMDVAHTSLRRALANQLTHSKATVPHYSVSADVNVDALLKLRERVRRVVVVVVVVVVTSVGRVVVDSVEC